MSGKCEGALGKPGNICMSNKLFSMLKVNDCVKLNFSADLEKSEGVKIPRVFFFSAEL